MSQFNILLNAIEEEIQKDISQKDTLQELEHKYELKLIPLKLYINTLSACNPGDLASKHHAADYSPFEHIGDILSNYTTMLSFQSCKQGQQERLVTKLSEDCFFLTLGVRYFNVIEKCFKRNGGDVIKVQMVGKDQLEGVIMTPKEIGSVLGLKKVDYQVYLLALLKLVDVIVDYTSSTVIRLSIGSTSPRDYTIATINSEIVSNLQKGFQLLDLKNDILRKKFDGLKYNSQRLNKIVYDLSLRSLITVKGEVL
ncbi:Translin [Spathaspora sp. JA1]|nr:Translin [Spathaspora sp. JA1]